MRVLVDTSVWIRFVQHGGTLGELLRRDEVVGHEFVYGELLLGDHGGRGRQDLLRLYEQMHQAPTVAHAFVVAFVRERRLHGRGVGWIDAHLLAAALVSDLRFWTADRPLAAIADELGVLYDASVSEPGRGMPESALAQNR